MKSPISPMGLSPSGFRNRIPTQMRRCLPIYLAILCFLLLLLNADLLGSIPRPKPIRTFKKRAVPSPYSKRPPEEPFPRKIWQTWKIDPLSFEQRDAIAAKSWTQRNPGYRYEVLTDSNDLAFVEEHFGPSGFNRPDIIDAYRNVNASIIRADMLRYMIMYAKGGVYADIDVEALKPIHKFIPERYDARDIDMVIGVEIDQPQFTNHRILGSKSQSFCQWTFMCRPGLPVMLRLIENIMAWLNSVAKNQGVPLADIVLDFDEVISGTGPSAFTAAVLEEMNARSKSTVTWDTFHDLDESKVVSRILVLHVEAFCAGQGHSDSGNHNSRGALVKHHYHASNWPSRHPRYKHPLYGEVERCNWNEDCVQQWDENVAAFAALTPEEQEKEIAEKAPDPSYPILGVQEPVSQDPPPQAPIV